MSRRDLLSACYRLRIRTDWTAQGKRGSKDNNWLRTDIIDRTYGPGMHWSFTSATQADEICVRAAHCCAGDFGYLLGVVQRCLKNGNDELTEYKRLCALKRRRSAEESALLLSAGRWFELSRIAQELHEIETALQQRRLTDGT